MKSVFAMITLSLIATQSFAAQRAVPTNEVSKYVQGVSLAFDKSNLKCEFADIRTILKAATSVSVDDSGPQPAIIMETFFSDTIRIVSRITTDASYSIISHIDISKQSVQPVNHGTMVQPNIVREWAQSAATSCDKQP